jgi:DNA repair photolyase
MMASEEASALTPVIVSASRATDIPAFYARWFLRRLEKGYLVWINPFNQQRRPVSFARTRVVVFWSKNPAPLLEAKVLEALDNHEFSRPGTQGSLFAAERGRGIHYYFQFTLNDYEAERLEPGVPPLARRIETFKRLAEKIGKEKVIWRFDPLLRVPGRLEPEQLLEKIERVGERIKGYTEKLVISFADIRAYRAVRQNLKREGIDATDMEEEKIHAIARGLGKLREKWGLQIASCAERYDLEQYGIARNHCVDGELIYRLFGKEDEDGALREHLLGSSKRNTLVPNWNGRKDKGQRGACGCVVSKDIGQYCTCPHACVYCYANAHPDTAKKNHEWYAGMERNGEVPENLLRFARRS